MRIIISTILLIVSIGIFGQNANFEIIWDKEEVLKLHFLEEKAELDFLTAQGVQLKYDGQFFKSSKHLFDQTIEEFSFDANALHYNEKTIVLPKTINCAQKIDEAFYIGTTEGLYYAELPLDLVAKKFHRPDLQELGHMLSISDIDHYTFFCDSTELMLWDKRRDNYRTMPNSFGRVNDAIVTSFGQLLLATENGLVSGNIEPEKNLSVPVLIVKESGFEDYRKTVQIDSGDLLIYTLDSRHPFHQEDIEMYVHLSGAGIDEQKQIFSSPYIVKDIPPGEYQLRFHSKLKDGIESNFSDKIYINVAAKKSNSFWWYLFGAIGLLFIFYGFGNFKNQQFNKDIVAQRDKLLLENKALKFEQQALQLQMNPHFIFNVLNSINGMIATNDNANARKYINEFSQLMRSVLNQSRTEMISLEDEINYLKKYMSLERVTRNSSFEYEILVDPHLDIESKTLPMIIQPFVENSIIHGFKNLERQAKLQVIFKEEKNQLMVLVEDNGIGRKPKEIGNHQSLGLTVVNERLGKDFGYTFDDLKAQDGLPSGTRVKIKMPLK